MHSSTDTPAIFHLTAHAVAVWTPEAGVQVVPIPINFVNNGEVIDVEGYRGWLSQVFTDHLPHVKLLTIILGHELVVSRQIFSQEAIGPFLATLPFQAHLVRSVTQQDADSFFVVATNGALYEPVVDIAQKQHITVTSVLPQTIFQIIAEKTQLSAEEYELMGKVQKSNYNFLQAVMTANANQNQSVTTSYENSGNPKRQFRLPVRTLLVGFIILIVLIGVACLGYRLKPWHRVSQDSASALRVLATPAATTAATISPVPIASPTAQERSAVRIQIFNGTGISGAAAKLAAEFLKTGYPHVTTANGQTNTGATTIDLATGLSPGVSKEITTVVQTLYPTAIISAAPAAASASATITIGLGR